MNGHFNYSKDTPVRYICDFYGSNRAVLETVLDMDRRIALLMRRNPYLVF